ncbi:hypothetical protein J3R74_004425 [Puniceicoccus vermicola]
MGKGNRSIGSDRRSSRERVSPPERMGVNDGKPMVLCKEIVLKSDNDLPQNGPEDRFATWVISLFGLE